jgi:hypothetical protein
MTKIVTHGFAPNYFLGAIFPDRRESICFNVEDSDKEFLEGNFPVYKNSDFKSALKARSKALLALEMERLIETQFQTEDAIFICWSSQRDQPLVTPGEIERLFQSVEVPDVNIELCAPLIVKAAECAVENQPVSMWVKLPANVESEDRTMITEALTGWITLSRRWWIEYQNKNPSIKEKTVASLNR